MVTCHDCGISDKTDKSISMRQCDWLLCNTCQASRATGVIRKRGSYIRGATAKTPIKTTSATDAKKTTSGQWQVAETPPPPPPPSNRNSNSNTPSMSVPCNSTPCVIKEGDITCCCFICQNKYHLTCANLTRRPAKTSNWCCNSCRNVPAMIADLKNNINVLSAWQKSMYEQQQALKAENSALKQQIAEIVKEQQNNWPSKRTPPTTAAVHTQSSESDIPMTSSDPDSPWIPVRNRRRRKNLPKNQTNLKDACNQGPQKSRTQRTLRSDSRESSDVHYQEHRVPHDRETRWNHDHDDARKSRILKHKPKTDYFVNNISQRHYHAYSRSNRPWNTDYHSRPSRARNTDYHNRPNRARNTDYKNSQRYAQTSACFNCGLPNHTSNECHFSHPVTCRTCGEIGHKSRWHEDQNNLRSRL